MRLLISWLSGADLRRAPGFGGEEVRRGGGGVWPFSLLLANTSTRPATTTELIPFTGCSSIETAAASPTSVSITTPRHSCRARICCSVCVAPCRGLLGLSQPNKFFHFFFFFIADRGHNSASVPKFHGVKKRLHSSKTGNLFLEVPSAGRMITPQIGLS